MRRYLKWVLGGLTIVCVTILRLADKVTTEQWLYITIGILIALGLWKLRELIYERY